MIPALLLRKDQQVASEDDKVVLHYPGGEYEMNIKHAQAIIDQVVEAVSQWPKLAKEQTDIPQNMIDAIEKTRVYL